ncbi:MAG: apolipoprotein N-acyltransferase [Treponema sp.]|nr:apolipoprotein N-acyltransferase [Treponema sp.]
MLGILQVFCTIFSAILQTTAISNEFFLYGFPLIGIICLVPLYISIINIKKTKNFFFLFALQCFFVHLLSSFWLGFYKDFALFTLGASALGSGFVAGISSIFLYFLLPKIKDKIGLRILSFSIYWVIWEWIKSSLGFLAYPWGVLSMTTFKWAWINQIADITGRYGISFLIVLINSVIAEWIIITFNNKYQKETNSYKFSIHAIKEASKGVAILFIITAFYGIVKLKEPISPIKTMKTIIVQQNLDPWLTKDDTNSIMTSMSLTEERITEFEENERADLVLWSEGVLKHPYPVSDVFYTKHPLEESLVDFINRMNTPFIIGAPYRVSKANTKPRRYSNSAILFDKNGNVAGHYNKMHLVPFGEYIPGLTNPKIAAIIKSVAKISNGWVPGNKITIFNIPLLSQQEECDNDIEYVELTKTATTKAIIEKPSVSFSIPICFEDAFPQLCRKLFLAGSEIFLNITDDSWSLTKSAEYQHFIIAYLRAIEFRTTLVRSTNSGLSAIVDPKGNITDSLPLFEACSKTVTVPIYKRTITAYAIYGDLFLYTLMSIFIFFIILFYCKPIEAK